MYTFFIGFVVGVVITGILIVVLLACYNAGKISKEEELKNDSR